MLMTIWFRCQTLFLFTSKLRWASLQIISQKYLIRPHLMKLLPNLGVKFVLSSVGLPLIVFCQVSSSFRFFKELKEFPLIFRFISFQIYVHWTLSTKTYGFLGPSRSRPTRSNLLHDDALLDLCEIANLSFG